MISWNVNGLRAVRTKGFDDIFASLNADFFCLQEIKLQQGQIDISFPGYFSFWNYAEKKGYSGTAIFTKHEPLSVKYGIGKEEHDNEGRVIALEYEKFWIVTVYTPNAKDDLSRLAYRQVWEDEFLGFIKSLERTKPVIFCGDLNVAHKEIEKFSAVLQNGFTDTFRYFYPELTGAYSWWSYRANARANNAGWRIDYFVCSESLNPELAGAAIHPEIYGSDHCPVELLIDI